MKFTLSKKQKIGVGVITGVVAFVLVLVIILTSVLVNLQYAKEEFALFSGAREILIKSFEELPNFESKEPVMPIDNTHPLNLVSYDGQDDILSLWKSIPEKQKKNTAILLSGGQILLARNENNLRNLEKWADTCEANDIQYCIQVINGETHMEARPPIAYLEQRFAKHSNFRGLNVDRLYEGVTLRGKAENDHTLYITDLIKLCAKYGAYFIWTETNLNYNNGIILDWFEENESFYSTFKKYSKYICMLNNEATGDPSTYAVMQGLWLSGLIGNWGIQSDWMHWSEDGYKSLFNKNNSFIGNETEKLFCYPENMFVQSVMLAMSRGGTCFSQTPSYFSVSTGGGLVAGYEYGISPLLNRIIDKKISIPTREDVLAATNFAVLGRENYSVANYSFNDSNIYPAQGASGIVPLLPKNLRSDERGVFLTNGIVLVDYKVSRKEFMKAFGQNDANTYLTNVGQNWYFINNLENKEGSKYATFTPKYADAESFYIESDEHSSAIIQDTRNGFKVYLSNYRTDKTQMIGELSDKMAESKNLAEYIGKFLTLDKNGDPIGVNDETLRTTIIEIKCYYSNSETGEPPVTFVNNRNGSGSNNRKYNVKSSYNTQTHTLRLEIEHNGMVDFEVQLDDSGKDYKIPPRGYIDDIYEKTNADTSELEELVQNKILDKHNYTYFSYLEYEKAYELAKVMINEGTFTQKQVDNQVKAFKSAKDNLINIQKEIAQLKKVISGEYQATAMLAYDSLLREILSCQKYVSGRSNKVSYGSIYANKNINCTFKAKRKAIQKAYDNLLIYG